MKKLLISFGLALLLLPSLASAAIFCPNLTQNMKQGYCDQNITDPDCIAHVTGDQVSELQHFLKDYFNNPTGLWMSGYFGSKTKAYVIKFQQEWDLYPAGNVFSLTRAAIQQACTQGTTDNNPPPPPPTQPTCTLSASPTSITLGQSSLLSWSSTNATQGYISNIGTVAANGSQSISPLLTTIYYGTFWGQGGSGQCNTTVTVSATATDHAPCTFNNQSIPHGQSVTAYRSATVASGEQCVREERTCHNGTLTGSYQYASCAPLPPPTCTPDPSSPQTQTLSCPVGQSGSITQMRTSSCPGPTWGAWTTTSNTCTTPNNGSPSITIHNPPNNATYSKGSSIPVGWTVGWTGTYNSANSYVRAILRNVSGVSVASFGISNDTTVSLIRTLVEDFPNGVYRLHFELINNATQNVITSAQRTMNISTPGNTQPSITITAPPSGMSVAQGSNLTISWTSTNAPAGSYVKVLMQISGSGYSQIVPHGNPSGSFDQPIFSIFSTGARTITAYLYDANGNLLSNQSTTINVTAPGNTQPAISLTAPPNNQTFQVGNAMNISWQSQNPPSGSYVTLALDAPTSFNSIASASFPVNGNYTWSIPSRPAGVHTLYALLSQSPTQTLAQAQISFTLGSPTASVGSCTYNGATYVEGSTYPSNANYICDNAAWVLASGIYSGTLFGCSPGGPSVCPPNSGWQGPSAIYPRHGNASLTVTTRTRPRKYTSSVCPAYAINWGDGGQNTEVPLRGGGSDCSDYPNGDHITKIHTHTYAASGSYTISLSDSQGSVTIGSVRVDSGTALAPQSTQLASAYTALLGALQSILKLLGQ